MTYRVDPFRIGYLEIEFPVVLGAIAGYSDHPYRLICRAHGAPYCTTEMMLDRTVLVGKKLRKRLLKLTDEDHPVAGQLIGNEPEVMGAAGRLLGEVGFDVVDLNFACPVKKTLRRGRGGYMMKDPALGLEIARAVIESVDRPVTLKLRRSFEQADTTCDAFWEIAEGAFIAGLAAICVHGRSVEAKYTGRADWEFISEVKRRFPDKTIIGSGDVLKPIDALRMLQQTGVDAVSVGRGALGNPWFFRQVRDIAAGREPRAPTISEQRVLLERHFRDACELYGTRRGPKIMRKFGIKYASMHPTPRDVRMGFVEVKTPEHWTEVLEKFYTDGSAVS